MRSAAVLRALVALVLAGASVSISTAEESQTAAADLTELTLEELMNVEVTLPSRRTESRARASSAVYVITQEEIRRSGFTHIPDLLRLVPGVQVASQTSSRWAVGIRGFGSTLTRSVLVLMDGRSVYTPLFAGTYWDVQDTVLEDIDRIEVIRGPGGTLWGANAVNGVINIVTKSSKETQGLLVEGGGGNVERGFGTVRWGGTYGDDLSYRLYGKYFDRSAFFNPRGSEYDSWWMARGGFRLDWRATEKDNVTFQGDMYDGEEGQRVGIAQYEPPFQVTVEKDADVSGGNLLGRWNHAFSDESDVVVQTYYDHTFRREPNFTEERNTFDIEAQHRFALPWRQEILWGFDYRYSHDDTHSVPTVVFDPPSKSLNLFSFFVQDDVWIIPDELRFTVGSKFEHSTYNDFNYQPSGTLLWQPLPRHSLWASISRAVRAPSRVDRDLFLTVAPVNLQTPQNDACLPAGAACVYPRVLGDRDFEPETLLAYQLGYRTQPFDRLFLDIAAFYNQYDNLLSLEQNAPFDEAEPSLPHVILPLAIGNQLHGESYGVEIAATVQVADWWRVAGAYSYLDIRLHPDAGSTDTTQAAMEDSSPHNQFVFQSRIDAPWEFQVDGDFRYVDGIRVGGQSVPSYVTFDVRLAKEIVAGLEIAAVGQNLWAPHHLEWAPGTEVPRGAYGQVRWQW